MTQNSTVFIGDFKVEVTEGLRTKFHDIHARALERSPGEPQFGPDEQEELRMACLEGVSEKAATYKQVERYESNLCELMHFLAENQVYAMGIDKYIRKFVQKGYVSQYLPGLTIRIHYEQKLALGGDSTAKLPAPIHCAPGRIATRESVMA